MGTIDGDWQMNDHHDWSAKTGMDEMGGGRGFGSKCEICNYFRELFFCASVHLFVAVAKFRTTLVGAQITSMITSSTMPTSSLLNDIV